MTISALIITRGDSPHLRATLGSIRTQLLPPDEVVVVTEKEVEEHRQLLERVLGGVVPRLSVLEGEDRGAARAWNLGISNCDSDFVAIIDDDDLWLPNHLSLCASTADITSSDIVLTGFYSLGGSVFREDMLPPKTLVPTDFMTFNPGMRGSNIFVRRQVIEQCGGFDEELATSSDRGLGIRISQMDGIRYTPVRVRTVLYRSHSGNRMVDPSPARLISFNRLLARHTSDLSEEQIAYTKGRIATFWRYPLSSLDGAECADSLVEGWSDFLVGESRPEDYPKGFQDTLDDNGFELKPFLCAEYHRRMENYDVVFPDSIDFHSPPRHRELIPQSLEAAAHPQVRAWVRRQPRGAIVDYGCGDGSVLTELIPEGYDIVLYDPDPVLEAEHREQAETWGGADASQLVLLQSSSSASASLRTIPINGGVSGVVCSMVVCQLDSEEEVTLLLNEMHSMLPHGGRALLCWCSDSLWEVDQTHLHRVISRVEGLPRRYEKKCHHSEGVRTEHVWDVDQLMLLAPSGLKLEGTWFTWGWDEDEQKAIPWIRFCELRRDAS